MVMDGDVAVVESGGKDDFAYSAFPYPVASVERILHDGDVVSLGGTELTPRKTPGHTRGCTTWTLKVREAGRTLNVVIVSPREWVWVDPEGYKKTVAEKQLAFEAELKKQQNAN